MKQRRLIEEWLWPQGKDPAARDYDEIGAESNACLNPMSSELCSVMKFIQN